uniref:Uncharacterized protein n=1 Tax=Arundo donax TaxID=35708 RepID=A0A0A9BWU1_ARUDO
MTVPPGEGPQGGPLASDLGGWGPGPGRAAPDPQRGGTVGGEAATDGEESSQTGGEEDGDAGQGRWNTWLCWPLPLLAPARNCGCGDVGKALCSHVHGAGEAVVLDVGVEVRRAQVGPDAPEGAPARFPAAPHRGHDGTGRDGGRLGVAAAVGGDVVAVVGGMVAPG